MNTPTPKVQLWTFTERMGGTDAVDSLIMELRENIQGLSVNDDPVIDRVIGELRELLDTERV